MTPTQGIQPGISRAPTKNSQGPRGDAQDAQAPGSLSQKACIRHVWVPAGWASKSCRQCRGLTESTLHPPCTPACLALCVRQHLVVIIINQSQATAEPRGSSAHA
jgi:hypothetical protein